MRYAPDSIMGSAFPSIHPHDQLIQSRTVRWIRNSVSVPSRLLCVWGDEHGSSLIMGASDNDNYLTRRQALAINHHQTLQQALFLLQPTIR